MQISLRLNKGNIYAALVGVITIYHLKKPSWIHQHGAWNPCMFSEESMNKGS